MYFVFIQSLILNSGYSFLWHLENHIEIQRLFLFLGHNITAKIQYLHILRLILTPSPPNSYYSFLGFLHTNKNLIEDEHHVLFHK